MSTQLLYATAPDGSTVSTEAWPYPDEATCPAEYGPDGTIQAWCTEPPGHPGPWHIASTGTKIIKVWPVAETGQP